MNEQQILLKKEAKVLFKEAILKKLAGYLLADTIIKTHKK